MGAKRVRIFGDSKLTIQQITGESQCLAGALNEYRERCMDIIRGFEQINNSHVSRDENNKVNALGQQASDYDVRQEKIEIRREPTSCAILAIQGDHSKSANDGRTMEDWSKVLIEYINNPSYNRD
jgi:ribonuclease HI